VVFFIKLKNMCKTSSSLKSENFGESETRDRIYLEEVDSIPEWR